MRTFFWLRSRSVGRHGFSLVELSVVVAIISVVATMGLEVAASYTNRSAMTTTQNVVTAADLSVQQFFHVYGRLPCPADLGTAPMNVSYGVEDCSISGVGTTVGGGVMIGAFPFRTLNLPMEASLDGFGDKLNYYVTKNLTVPGLNAGQFGYFGGTADQDGLGAIEIRHGTLSSYEVAQDPATSATQTTNYPAPYSTFFISDAPGAAYAISSSGPDRRGAYTRNGVLAVACIGTPVGSYNQRVDSQNCYNTVGGGALLNGIGLNVLYDKNFNNGSGNNYINYFDDVMTFRTKENL